MRLREDCPFWRNYKTRLLQQRRYKMRAFKSVSSLSSTWYFIIEHFLSSLMSTWQDRFFVWTQVPINLRICFWLVRATINSRVVLRLIHDEWNTIWHHTISINQIFCSENLDVNFISYGRVYLFDFHVKSRPVKKTDHVFAFQTGAWI